MNKKDEFAHAVGTLLALDHCMIKDLMHLQPETLVKMYNNYIQNAKDANNKLEEVIGAVMTKQGSKRLSYKQKLEVIHNA